MASLGRWLRGLFAGDVESSQTAFPEELSQRVDVESRAEPNKDFDQAFYFAEDNNNFALGVYERLRQRPGNLFFLRSVFALPCA